MNDINTIYDAITKRRCCSNGGSSDDSGGSVTAPLVVEGTWDASDTGVFTPDAEQPTWNEAKEAFLSGTPVFLKTVEGEVILIDMLYPAYNSDVLILGQQGAGISWPEQYQHQNTA